MSPAKKKDTRQLMAWRDAVRESDLSPATRLVALALSYYVHWETLGHAHPGIRTLANRSNVHTSTVVAALAKLEKLGWIACTFHATRPEKGGQRLASEYRLTFPDCTGIPHSPATPTARILRPDCADSPRRLRGFSDTNDGLNDDGNDEREPSPENDASERETGDLTDTPSARIHELFSRKNGPKHKADEVDVWLETCRARGYSDDEILQVAVQASWPRHLDGLCPIQTSPRGEVSAMPARPDVRPAPAIPMVMRCGGCGKLDIDCECA